MTSPLDPFDNTMRLIQAAPIGICVTNAEGRFEMVNPAYCELYGYRREELLGQPFTLVVPEHNRRLLADLHDSFIAGDSDEALAREWEVLDRAGESKNIMVRAARIVDAAGEVKKVTFVVDITERKAMERRLEFLACHDELTGLLNRRAGLAKLEDEVARSQRYGSSFCVAACDLDHFKRVNDRYGHATGDKVLRETADLMRSQLRRCDHVIRLGGEEFLILLPGVGQQDAWRALDRLRHHLSATPLAEVNLQLTLSCGVAQARETDTSDTLLERADDALYQAKDAGRNRVVQAP